MSSSRYESYRDSGIQLLGEIPSHWKIERLKRLCDVRPSNVDKKSYEGEESIRLCNYTDVYYHERITESLDLMEATASQAQIERFSLSQDDVIVTKDSETSDDIAIASYVPANLPGVLCGYHLALLRPKRGVEGKFIKRYFDSPFAKASVAIEATGLTRVGLSQYVIDNLSVPTPPVAEQRLISEFLDRETTKIDTLVEEQRQLIELLKEKRQATISDAVTKGIEPNVPMKYSRIEWLGEVPAHWELTSLKRICPEITVGIVVEPSKYYVDEGVPALRSLNVKPGSVVLDDMVFISPEANELHSKSKLRSGDIVAVRSGQPGTAAVIPDQLDGANCIDLIIIRRASSLCERFLCWYLSSEFALLQFSQGSEGAIQQHFNVGSAKQLIVCLPPYDEQRRISDMLEREINVIDGLQREAEKGIALLSEHRAALISAAVTGKIDVRGLVAVPKGKAA